MQQSEKDNYCEKWNEHLHECMALAFTADPVLSKKVRLHIHALLELVPLVADDKIRASKVMA